MDEKLFLERLNQLVNSNGCSSQDEFVDAFNDYFGYECLRQSTLSGYLNGKHLPPSDKLISFAEYFNVSTDYLLGLENEPQNKNDRFISQELGLSQESIDNLRELHFSYFFDSFLKGGIDKLLSSDFILVMRFNSVLFEYLKDCDFPPLFIEGYGLDCSFELSDYKELKLAEIKKVLSELDNHLNNTDEKVDESTITEIEEKISIDTRKKEKEQLKNNIQKLKKEISEYEIGSVEYNYADLKIHHLQQRQKKIKAIEKQEQKRREELFVKELNESEDI